MIPDEVFSSCFNKTTDILFINFIDFIQFFISSFVINFVIKIIQSFFISLWSAKPQHDDFKF